MMKNIKLRIYEILEVAKPGDKLSRYFDVFIMGLILLNILAVILATIKSLSNSYGILFENFEIFSVAVFTFEYILRVWSRTAFSYGANAFKIQLRYMITPLAVVDLFAILPFYLPMLIPFDLRFIRAVRLFRLFRLFKMGRYSASLKMIVRVFKSRKEDLLVTLFVVLILLVIASSLMYFVENEVQPEAFSSIPAAMWWGVATLTTVGYGDIYSVTVPEKILGSVISVLGVGLFALPTGILASSFAEEMRKKDTSQICPYCKKEI